MSNFNLFSPPPQDFLIFRVPLRELQTFPYNPIKKITKKITNYPCMEYFKGLIDIHATNSFKWNSPNSSNSITNICKLCIHKTLLTCTPLL